ncbi:hypothetical protein NC651_010493 [Populus alba x Populus x berolinensis]|nr:hypothetical protein NC651_010493 [Populus alba x Populus x berolinensis]
MQGSLAVGMSRDWRALSCLGFKVELLEGKGVLVVGGVGEEVGEGEGGRVAMGEAEAASVVVAEMRKRRRRGRRRGVGGGDIVGRDRESEGSFC